MKDLAEIFKDGPHEKGSFLSRVFGIFNEEIIRIWARDYRSPYNNHEKRPTLYDLDNKPHTLDFLFEKDGKFYVSEMKCEIQYNNYRYWRLESSKQLEHHKKNAFKLFLKIAKDPMAVPVKAGDAVVTSGAILVWGAAYDHGIKSVSEEFGFSDILTVENCMRDLVQWSNTEYIDLLEAYESWCGALFNALKGHPA